MTAPTSPRRHWHSPTQVVVSGFLAAILMGTLLLMLPISTTDGLGTPWNHALFTATSAVCVTGLATVDVATYFTPFGHVVMMLLVQIGGFGVMTLGSILALLLAHRLGLRERMTAAVATKASGLGAVKQLLTGIFVATFAIEGAIALLLTLRFGFGYGRPFGEALWLGIFHAVSAFNNAGFALFSDSLISFATDPLIIVPICAAIMLGGFGFPALFELRRRYRLPARWSLNLKMMVWGTAVLLVAGTVLFLLIEWNNPATLGAHAPMDRPLVAFTAAVMPRTAGFISVPIAQMHDVSLLLTDFLMFIGGGPAGTAGGVKITTIIVLFAVVWSEVTAQNSVVAFRRRIPRSVQREATTVLTFSMVLVLAGIAAVLATSGAGLGAVALEVTSAFGTVGLSADLTPTLPISSQLILVGMMFIGRLGPVTLANALAGNRPKALFRFPNERPLIG